MQPSSTRDVGLLSSPADQPSARRLARRRVARRRRGVGVLAVIICAGLVALLLARGSSGGHGAVRQGRREHSAPVRPGQLRAVVKQEGELPNAVQDAASASDGRGGVLLIGGLTGEEASVPDVLSLAGGSITKVASLPAGVHDACASEAGNAVYLFGGGEQISFSGILGVRRTGSSEQVSSLPTPASDVACAALGDTVYVIGGYTGSEPLRTILAWRPGGSPRVAGTLPKPLRYAAVGQVGGRILIAGGTSGVEASQDVYSFDPSSGSVRQIGRLPYPLTHAAGVALGGVLLVIGGRDQQAGTQRSSILSVSPAGAVSVAGRLPLGLSDTSAAVAGGEAILAGGVDKAGRLQRAVLRLSVSG